MVIYLSLHKLVHWISKDARYKIIEVMLTTRSTRQLAEELGVTSAAVNKYIYRKTHPSDATVARALSILGEYERQRVMQIIVDDIIRAVEILSESLGNEDKEVREYLISRLEWIVKRLKENG